MQRHKPYDPQEEPDTIDEKTASGNGGEFFTTLQNIDYTISDDEVMEILRYASSREQARRRNQHPGQQG